MFTLEQVTDIHDRLDNKGTLGGYLSALRDIGVEAYDSYIADGHSEYFGTDGQILVGPAFHETFAIAETCDREEFLRYMEQVDTDKLTITPAQGRADERAARSDSLLGAGSGSRQALATQIPNRLAERLRVGDLPPG